MKAKWEVRPGLVYDGELTIFGSVRYFVKFSRNEPYGPDYRSQRFTTREAALEDAKAHGIEIEENDDEG